MMNTVCKVAERAVHWLWSTVKTVSKMTLIVLIKLTTSLSYSLLIELAVTVLMLSNLIVFSIATWFKSASRLIVVLSRTICRKVLGLDRITVRSCRIWDSLYLCSLLILSFVFLMIMLVCYTKQLAVRAIEQFRIIVSIKARFWDVLWQFYLLYYISVSCKL